MKTMKKAKTAPKKEKLAPKMAPKFAPKAKAAPKKK
jgi:hypothetical protein